MKKVYSVLVWTTLIIVGLGSAFVMWASYETGGALFAISFASFLACGLSGAIVLNMEEKKEKIQAQMDSQYYDRVRARQQQAQTRRAAYYNVKAVSHKNWS